MHGINKFVVRLLSCWYYNQEACVRWKGSISCNFRFSNGTRQGGVLSPFMVSRYIRDMLCELVEADAGCNIGGVFINVLAYVDDLVLCAPTWQALQHLINLLAKQAAVLQLTVNLCKTVCMVFPPKDKTKILKNFSCTQAGREGVATSSRVQILGTHPPAQYI